MSLWEEFQEICTMKNKNSVPDGQGGFNTVWSDGASFMAAITKDTSVEAMIAEKQGVTALYTITTSTSSRLEYHDVFKRNSDGTIFRVTSNYNDTKPPKRASFSFYQVTAEEWKLS